MTAIKALIESAKALIESAEAFLDARTYQNGYVLEAAIASAKAAEEETKWIDVKQELPKRSESRTQAIEHKVLLVMHGRYVYQGSCFAFSDSVEWRVPHVCGSINESVTHWRYQPAPPVIETREKEGLDGQ